MGRPLLDCAAFTGGDCSALFFVCAALNRSCSAAAIAANFCKCSLSSLLLLLLRERYERYKGLTLQDWQLQIGVLAFVESE
jgi:hypothetical protein